MPKVEENKVVAEEVEDGVDSDDVDEGDEDTGAVGEDDKNQSKGERKARKALLKLGLKPMSEINRVTIRRQKGVLFVIAKPEVYKSSGSDTFLVFGEVKVEDGNQAAQMAAQRAYQAQELLQSGNNDASADDQPPELAEDVSAVDAEGVEEKDISLVMAQANVSRAKAIKALKSNDNDIVNAIMELTL